MKELLQEYARREIEISKLQTELREIEIEIKRIASPKLLEFATMNEIRAMKRRADNEKV